MAHTFMLVCEYTELVEYQRGSGSLLKIPIEKTDQVKSVIDEYDSRYPFNNRYLISLERMAENNGLDLDSYKANSFTSGVSPATNRGKTQRKIKTLLAEYPSPSELSEQQLHSILSNEFSEKEVAQIIGSIHEYKYQALSPDFVEAYLNEKDNLKFEDRTGEILRAIGFDITMRPNPVQDVSTEIEILAEYGSTEFGIIDAKNYRQKFVLSSNLVSHMASEYIPNYEGYNGKKLTFFGYVTAAGIGGEKNLSKISMLSQRVIPDRDIHGFMINAAALVGFLDYCIDNELEKEQRISLFRKTIKNNAFTCVDQMLRAIE